KVGYPAIGIVKQPYGGKFRLTTHIKPVCGAGGYSDQVVLLAQHLIHLTGNVQAKQALATDKKAYLIFTVCMLCQKFLPQRGFVGVIGTKRDNINSNITTFLF